MAKIENKDIIEALKEKTILEVKELVDMMKEEFGVDPSAVAVAAAPAAATDAPAVEEKTEFKVVLKTVGANKIGVIKVVKEITGLGLVESKALAVDGATIKEGVSKEDADKMIAKFKEAGAEAIAD